MWRSAILPEPPPRARGGESQLHFAIRYLTEYQYGAAVTDNLNALRVRPATTSSQRCDEFHTRIEPEARVSRHLDYFGTEVLEFGIPTAHEQLIIDVRARVVTSEPPEPPDGSWESLLSEAYLDAAGEFALPWQDQPVIHGLDDLHDALDADSPLETLELLCELVPDRFDYRPGVTYVGSTIGDLLKLRAGVCQDFVHLSLVLLRRRGIAARYVSGYLWAAPEDGGADSLEVDTHAWLEALLPGTDGHGEPMWVGADPTNRTLAKETHVKVGHGRFYADVPPVKGLYLGGATSQLTAAVSMSRLDPQAGARA
jgi:transglutaminase-like putative cysteine protease